MSRFGVARLASEYEQATQQVTSAASDMGRSLEDLRQHAARFSEAFSVTRRSDLTEASKQLTLDELLAQNRGILSLHAAFANMQSSERMRFVSASQWLHQLCKSKAVKIDGNFITGSSGFDEISAAFLAEIPAQGASLISLCGVLGCDLLVAKEVVNRLSAKGQVCVDESIEGVRYFKNILFI
jgi:hypothetical protein